MRDVMVFLQGHGISPRLAARIVKLYGETAMARVRDLVLRPPARFLRAYLLKRGFLDGVVGFVIAVATAFHVFLKYAKLWELERAGPTPGR